MVSLAMPSHPTPGFRLRHRLPSSPRTEKNNNHHRINTEPNEQRNEPVTDLMLRSERGGGANLRLLLAALFPLADPLVLPHRHLTAAAAAALGSGGSGGGVAGGAASWSGCRCRGSVPPRARPRSACVRSARGVGMEGRARGERGRVRRRRRGRRHREGVRGRQRD